MPKEIIYSIDVERDLHTGKDKGIKQGLLRFEKICDKHKVKPVLFIVSSLVKEHKDLFKRLSNKGWEISLHGYSHKRFDEMSYDEKEAEIKKSIIEFKKHLGIKPKGFRAPQHGIDRETLDLLENYGFKYDSSYTPLNAMQIIYFPYRPILAVKLALSRLNPYKIRKNLLEIPAASLLIPFVSLTLRVFPKWVLGIYVKLIKAVYKKPVFYAHSWDFIKLKDSRIDRLFRHKKVLSKLDYIMGIK